MGGHGWTRRHVESGTRANSFFSRIKDDKEQQQQNKDIPLGSSQPSELDWNTVQTMQHKAIQTTRATMKQKKKGTPGASKKRHSFDS